MCIRTSSNINLNRLNQADLEPLYEVLKGLGIFAWQVQLTVPMGRAADRLVEAKQRLAEAEENLAVCSKRVEELAARFRGEF